MPTAEQIRQRLVAYDFEFEGGKWDRVRHGFITSLKKTHETEEARRTTVAPRLLRTHVSPPTPRLVPLVPAVSAVRVLNMIGAGVRFAIDEPQDLSAKVTPERAAALGVLKDMAESFGIDTPEDLIADVTDFVHREMNARQIAANVAPFLVAEIVNRSDFILDAADVTDATDYATAILEACYNPKMLAYALERAGL